LAKYLKGIVMCKSAVPPLAPLPLLLHCGVFSVKFWLIGWGDINISFFFIICGKKFKFTKRKGILKNLIKQY